jgi:hypothetical protein
VRRERNRFLKSGEEEEVGAGSAKSIHSADKINEDQ